MPDQEGSEMKARMTTAGAGRVLFELGMFLISARLKVAMLSSSDPEKEKVIRHIENLLHEAIVDLNKLIVEEASSQKGVR